MSDRDTRIDHEAGEAIKRMEGPEVIFVGVPVLIGLGFLVACLQRR